MNQYQIELIYEPLYYILVVAAAYLILRIDRLATPYQLVIVGGSGIIFILIMIYTYLNRKTLEQEPVHFTSLSKILMPLIFVIGIGAVAFLLY